MQIKVEEKGLFWSRYDEKYLSLFVLERLSQILFFSLIIYTLINDYLNHVFWYP